MPPPDPFLLYSRKFQELHVPHMITGSAAAMFYGEPRLTNDVDFVVALTPPSPSRPEVAKKIRFLGLPSTSRSDIPHPARARIASVPMGIDDPILDAQILEDRRVRRRR